MFPPSRRVACVHRPGQARAQGDGRRHAPGGLPGSRGPVCPPAQRGQVRGVGEVFALQHNMARCVRRN